MQVTELWRYPAKTMAGEKLPRIRLGPLGIDGDRVVHVEDAWGRVVISRSHPRFLGHEGSLDPDGTPLGAAIAGGHRRRHRGVRPRRSPPNIVIDGVEELAEREWPGGCIRIGPVLIGVQDLRLRCIMTSYDPDTLIQDREITRSIYRRFEGKLALNGFVIEGGEIAVGDDVQLVRGRACAESTASVVFAE